MAETNGRRFGISTISKSKVSSAFNGELMGNKETGELLFKTPDGDGISFMENSRRNYNIDTLGNIMRNYGYKEFNIYEADMETFLPDVIPAGAVMTIPKNDTDMDSKFNAYSILADIDCFEKNLSGITTTNLDAILTITLSLYADESSEPTVETVSCTVSELKNKVFVLAYDAVNISISIEVNLPDEYVDIDSRIILHSVMVATNIIE